MHVSTWSEKDRKEFLSDLQKNGSFLLFRIPRGFKDSDLIIERSKSKKGGEANQG